MSSTISFEAIEPLLQSSDIDGETLTCTFTCPRSGETVNGKVSLTAANKGSIVSSGKATLQKRMARSMKKSVLGSLSSVLGTGTVGTVARQMAGQAVDRATSKRHISDAERQRAIVLAFEKTGAFILDEATQEYVHKNATA